MLFRSLRRLKHVVHISFCFIIIVSVVVFLLSFFAGESIAWVFAKDNRNVFLITKTGFAVFSFSFLFSGCNIFASALFTALSNGKASAVISFLRTFVFIIIFLLILPRFLEVTGVWAAVPVAELFTLAATVGIIYNVHTQSLRRGGRSVGGKGE